MSVTIGAGVSKMYQGNPTDAVQGFGKTFPSNEEASGGLIQYVTFPEVTLAVRNVQLKLSLKPDVVPECKTGCNQ